MTIEDTKISEPMSKEEMTDTLKGLVFGTFDRTTAKEREALDMAIKALEQQPCEDCISRQEVISAIQDKYYDNAIGIDIVDMIAHVPAAIPEQLGEHFAEGYKKGIEMNKLGLNIPEQPNIPPMPKKKAAVNRQVIVTWFTPEEKLPEEDIGVLATVTARAKNREFIRAILTVFYCKSEGWYELDYGFSELIVHAWCDLEPYEGE